MIKANVISGYSNWKKIITKDSNAILNHVTSSGNLIVNGDLYAKLDDAPTNNDNLKVVTINPSNDLLFITGSYGGSSTVEGIQVKLNNGSYVDLESITLNSFQGNVSIVSSGGTIDLDFS